MALLVRLRLAAVFTLVTAVAELLARFESALLELIVAVLDMFVLLAVLLETCETTVNVVEEPAATDGLVQVIVPPLPTAGSEQLQPFVTPLMP